MYIYVYIYRFAFGPGGHPGGKHVFKMASYQLHGCHFKFVLLVHEGSEIWTN